MKFFRAALIILVILIAVKSFGKYTEQRIAQKERQELLNSFISDVSPKSDLLKDDTSHFNEQGNIISPANTKTVSSGIQKELSIEKKEQTPVSNYIILGRIQIDKIQIDYPIIDTSTTDTLNLSITRFCGSEINSPGNCILAGHNMKDGSLFGKLKELSVGDIAKIYDSTGRMKQYKITECYVVEPTDLKPLNQETNGNKIITLITCTNKGKQRLIVKAKAN